MDVEVALAACRAIVAGDYPTSEASRDTLARFKENFAGLDEWISRGGALAEAAREWRKIRQAAAVDLQDLTGDVIAKVDRARRGEEITAQGVIEALAALDDPVYFEAKEGNR